MKLSFQNNLLLLVAACLAPSSTNANSNAGAAALQALKNIDYRYFVAGGTCAAISHGITTPIDVVKTKIQANPNVSE
jgi:solute carrier family 25 phosphate transporter 3